MKFRASCFRSSCFCLWRYGYPHWSPLQAHGGKEIEASLRLCGIQRRRSYAVSALLPNPNLKELNIPSTVTEDPEKCTERLLEWDELCVHVGRFAQTSGGKKACRDLRIAEIYEEALELQAETKAVEALTAKLKVEFRFGKVSTDLMKASLERCAKGGVLTEQQLMSISALLTVAIDIRDTILTPFRKQGIYQDLRKAAQPMYDPWRTLELPYELKALIDFAIDEEGNLKDNASADLSDSRFQYRAIKKRLEVLIKSFKGKVVDRSGRICLALTSDKTVPADALILDSGSHGTIYCEPRAALPLNNDLASAYGKMKSAEEAILANLTEQTMHHVEDLQTLLQMVIGLDVALARVRYTEWIDGSFPHFSYYKKVEDDPGYMNSDFFLSLINLRHPLLMGQSLIYKAADSKRAQKDDFRFDAPIPNDVILSSQTRALVITGPNAGGKTATLKALGLCALMAKAGLGLPAKQPVSIPFYSAILADIGDEQSITSSLSTFSGHLRRIQNLRNVADGHCLVLLDELGTGTDPKEGAALGAALLTALVKGGPGGALTTVISTHHALLTTLAYDHPEGQEYSVFENASMEFDDEDLAPTYRLMLGVPGQSNALNIASRLGMDLRIIGDAKRRLGSRHASENILISKIQDEKESLEEISEDVEDLENEKKCVESMIVDMEVKNSTLEYQLSIQEADVYFQSYNDGKASLKLLMSKKEKTETAFKQQNKGTKQVMEFPSHLEEGTSSIEQQLQQQEKQEKVANGLEGKKQKKENSWVPEVGDVVYVHDLVRQGTIIDLKRSKGQAVIKVGLLTITVDIGSLEPY